MNRVRKTNVRTDHQFVEERLSAYLDGELSPQDRTAVERHLTSCPACQWQAKTLRQTVEWTRTLPTVPVPRVFTIPPFSEPVPAPRMRRSFVPLLQGATALIAMLLFVVIAGDAMLTGFSPAAPRPAAVMEASPSLVEVTEEVAMMVEAPAAPAEAEAAAAKSAPEAEVPAAPQEVAATEIAAELPLAAPEAAALEAAAAATPAAAVSEAAAEATPEVGVAGTMGLGGGPEAPTATEESETPPALKLEEGPDAPAGTDQVEAAGEGAPVVTATPTMTQPLALADSAQPSLGAPPSPPSVEPSQVVVSTAVVAVQEAAPAAAAPAPPAPQTTESETLLRRPPTILLRAFELSLGLALLLMATLTVVAMIQQRRSR
jgi:hypothetical protein